MLHGPKNTQRLAKRLRRAMTLPEVLLWQALRPRPAGLRFRRQHPAGRYVLDFFCPAHRLAVEVDGEAHSRGSQPRHDAARDDWLRGQGVRVLRVPAADVLNDLEAVVRYIVATAVPGSSYPSVPLRGPPPPPGEE
ncbi:endonuclease domain-containing protein [Sphingomonas bacterium]|uniref:endonuclease domain-containing protein n=1 Tax=Sphingomonas bacterium TaxID=1895847 RepID=UPI001574EE79|nr:endonuclease domain-containing protein [Sphingomonas bacterium]